jgi:hypothetical protein
MTGAQFYTLLQQKIDKAYSAYIDTGKANRIIEETIFRLCDKIYRDLDLQKEYDELWSLLVKDEVKTITTPPYYDLSGLSRTYMHLFRIAFTFHKLQTFSSVSFTGVGPYIYVFVAPGHVVRKGDLIADTAGQIGTCTKVTRTTFTVSTNLVFNTGEPMRIVIKREAKPYVSDRKIDKYHTPTIYSPKYQLQNRISGVNNIKSLYLFPAPQAIEIDYMAEPTVTNGQIFTSTGATQITAYTEKFLYRLLDECVFTYAGQVRDAELRSSSAQDITINP